MLQDDIGQYSPTLLQQWVKIVKSWPLVTCLEFEPRMCIYLAALTTESSQCCKTIFIGQYGPMLQFAKMSNNLKLAISDLFRI